MRIGKTNLVLMLVMFAFVAGCSGLQTRTKSSVVDYLYPYKSDEIVEPETPVLNLPVKVGIAFVLEQGSQSKGFSMWSGTAAGGTFTEKDKAELLEKIAVNFRNLEFVSDIEVIPSPYLNPGGSFANLDQIKTMYGIDIIALVSFDQVQFTDEGFLTLTYWTLIGAYVVSGEKNDTSTMLDTAVYDIESRKMLFRAPGTSTVKGSSTPVNLSEELRADSVKSFTEATAKMISNLEAQLDNFKEKIKRKPEQVKITHSAGYSGGGAMFTSGIFDGLVMLCLLGVTFIRKKI